MSEDKMLEELLKVRDCKCSLCEEGRFIKRVAALLPEAEAKELNDWYCASLDADCERQMKEAAAQHAENL